MTQSVTGRRSFANDYWRPNASLESFILTIRIDRRQGGAFARSTRSRQNRHSRNKARRSKPWTSVIGIDLACDGAGPSPIKIGRSSARRPGRRGCPAPAAGRAGSRRTTSKPQFLLHEPPHRPTLGPPQAMGRRTARRGRSLACGGCRPSARNPGPAVIEPVRISEPRVGSDKTTSSPARGWSSPISRRRRRKDCAIRRQSPIKRSRTRSRSSVSGDINVRDSDGRRRRTRGCRTCRELHRTDPAARSETPPRAARD